MMRAAVRARKRGSDMAGRMEGKRALVTAAGQGIGRAIAVAFAREGANVVATDIAADKLATLKSAGVYETAVVDVTDKAAIARFAGATKGPFDVLANCAGWVADGTVLDCDDNMWDRTFALNVTSMFHMIKTFLPPMIDARRGSIINISSVVSSIKAVPRRFAYGASKAAIVGLTKSVAMDYITTGVRCNAICPGTIDTPSLHERIAAHADYESARKAFIARQPMGRLGTAEEMAAIAVYLGADESAFTTGSLFVADGGLAL
jgi:2-keto-3-deoxy-L-fuconate dehydrogenase